MNLYQYYKAISMNNNKMMNPVLISEDKTRDLAVVTYNQIAPQFSWDIPLIQNARGLVLDTKTGDVVSRPYPKFFNYGENKLAYWPHDTTGMVAEEKLDGSLVIVSTYKNNLIVSSSGSLTSEHSELFQNYLENNLSESEYSALFEAGKTYTMLFEYVGPDNKIVLQYDKENMIMHGAIKTQQDDEHNIIEMEYEKLKQLSNDIGIDIVKTYPLKSFDDVHNIIQNKTNFEGFVIKFTDGHRLKFKTDDYIKKHQIATDLELNVDSKKLRETFVQSIVSDSYDDLLPYLSETRPLLDEMITTTKEFITEATKRKSSYIKENEHLTVDSVDIESIRTSITKLPQQLQENQDKFTNEINTYIENIDNDTLIEKGYARITNAIDTRLSTDKKITRAYTNNNIKNGLINTQSLDKKQKQLVAHEPTTTIMDKYIKTYLFGADMMNVIADYLSESYVTNIPLSETQKLNNQIRNVAQLTKQANQLSLSPELTEKLRNVLDEAEHELIEKRTTYNQTNDDEFVLNMDDLNTLQQ